MRDTRTQKELQITRNPVDIAGRDPLDVTREILKAMSAAPDSFVTVQSKGERYFLLALESLCPAQGYALAYRLLVEPGKEGQVESFAGKRYSDFTGVEPSRARIRSGERLVGSCSRHWIGEDEVVLPFIGEIAVARRSMITGPPNPFAPQVFCDHGDMAAYCSRWAHGEYAASISLGLNKEVNEDGALCRLLPEGPAQGASLLGVVADGMGGHVGGQAAVMSILNTFATADFSESGLKNVARLLPYRLTELYHDVMQRPEQGVTTLVGPSMGAPFAAVRIFDGEFEALRAGDCRIVHYRRLAGEYRCVWSSKDQGVGSMVDNPACLVSGEPSPLVLRPETFTLSHDDYVVVATDGVWKRLDLNTVGRILSQSSSAEVAEGAIVQSIALAEFERNASDNRGIIVYRHECAT